ncbi:hypothetical protein Tco_0623850 [Tanacetum coccineum]|uniref:Uncharacterized protein n=1 Tax=Tanacetum coccineum TaxID=301880 RepID=A0ABQ4WCE7_9ASTR
MIRERAEDRGQEGAKEWKRRRGDRSIRDDTTANEKDRHRSTAEEKRAEVIKKRSGVKNEEKEEREGGEKRKNEKNKNEVESSCTRQNRE